MPDILQLISFENKKIIALTHRPFHRSAREFYQFFYDVQTNNKRLNNINLRFSMNIGSNDVHVLQSFLSEHATVVH